MKRTPPGDTPLLIRLAATFLLIGEAAPFAPATFASLALLPGIHFFVGFSGPLQVILTVAVIGFGTWVSTRAETYYGHDAGAIVIDEVAGMLVTFLWVPLPESSAGRWGFLVLGFFLFRIFDILKPFPAGRAQQLRGGMGVMADDLWAGLYANLVLRVGLELL